MDAKLAGGSDRARALALFVTVVEAGSFSAAARTLALTPSAVARAVDRIEARLHARGSKRWYSGAAFADGVGGNFDITYYLSGRTGVFANVGITRLDYPQIPAQNGVVGEYSLGAFHALTPSSIGRASFTAASFTSEPNQPSSQPSSRSSTIAPRSHHSQLIELLLSVVVTFGSR